MALNHFKVEIRIRAKEEVDEISFYYENLSAGLGKRFYKEFKESSKTLINNPYFQVKYGTIRKLTLKTFPYSIHFTIDEKQMIVHIEAVSSDYLLPFSGNLKK